MRNLKIREMKSSTFVCLIPSPQYEKRTGSAGEGVGLLRPRPFPPSGCFFAASGFSFQFCSDHEALFSSECGEAVSRVLETSHANLRVPLKAHSGDKNMRAWQGLAEGGVQAGTPGGVLGRAE